MVCSDSAGWNLNHENTIEELLYLLQNAMIGYCLSSDNFAPQYKINVITNINELFKTVDGDGRISKNRVHLICNYGRLGRYYYEIGDNDNSIKYLTLAAKAAIDFDAQKNSEKWFRYYENTGVFKDMNMSRRMKELMLYHYHFSDEFKSSEEFKKVLSIFGENCGSERVVF